MSGKNVSVKRHIAKTITWRILATTDTILLSWLITGELTLGLAIGALEVVTKMGLYFLHERTWYKSNFGIKEEPPMHTNGNENGEISETEHNGIVYKRPRITIREYDN